MVTFTNKNSNKPSETILASVGKYRLGPDPTNP